MGKEMQSSQCDLTSWRQTLDKSKLLGALDNKCIVWLSTTLIATLALEFLLSSLAKYLAPEKKKILSMRLKNIYSCMS